MKNTVHKIKILIAFVFVISKTSQCFAQTDVLSEGQWFKLAVQQAGVYRIDRNQLRNMGVDVNRVDPRKIRIYAGHQGLLPQPNAANRLQGLQELAIYIEGETDGNFGNNDFILFYAEGPDRFEYDVNRATFFYERNYFTRSNYYFLQVSEENGKRITQANDPGEGQIIDTFDSFGFYKRDQFNILSSGRQWYGERFDQITSHTINFDFPDIVEGSSITLISSVMAQSFSTSNFKVFVNDFGIAEQSILPVSNFRYALKGRTALDTIRFNASTVNANANSIQRIRLQYEKNNSGLSVGYLDYLLIHVKQRLNLFGDQTIFTAAHSIASATSTYAIGNADANVMIWDITDRLNARSQNFTVNNQQTRFNANSAELKNFVIFRKNNRIPAPQFIGRVDNQHIAAHHTPNLLVVAHPDLLAEANRLAAFRNTQQVETLVVSTEQIFNEFSGGKPDATAIRDYVRYLYLKSPNTLKNLLLFGKGSYDYLDILNRNLNLVPTYESRNSLHPLETYSSDDYFTFLEEHEGNWGESPVENHTMDIGVGRIPAKNLNEARAVVDKLIAYDQPEAFGQWRKNIVFVADDGDFNIHNSQANQLADNIELNHPEFNTRKIFLDAFPQISRPAGQASPETTKAIVKVLEQGALILNYTGHGSEQVWADERILDGIIIANLENKHYPLLLTATCEFGRHDNPTEISSGELSLLLPGRAAIALVTTARPVSSSTNFELNRAFYQSVFQKEDGKGLSIGEVFKLTKNLSLSGVANRNFSLLGDPSMKLAVPYQQIKIESIETADGSDMIKALSKVTVKGNVLDAADNQITNFNGILEATVFDKPVESVTLGNDNPPFNFLDFDQAIFRGKASIADGSFAFDFIAPKNISYQPGDGKISLYASSPALVLDATGADNNVQVGLSELINNNDNTPPQIQLFMGDASFIDDGYVPANTTLLARITDDSGINISSFGLGNIMSAQLNDEAPFPVNDYFIADIDDPSSGWLRYPLKNLSPGKHTIILRAWDVFNNPAVASIGFQVTRPGEFIIESFKTYPNPVKAGDRARLELVHSRSGERLEANIQLLNNMGSLIAAYQFEL
ncbi:MAG TPA: type IX secretion system sortase PorU, partial [Cyclobacteriaceae bacterium]|nr:type IX secretion system sortase PorU [Cyclobacteriaceae bacterium]